MKLFVVGQKMFGAAALQMILDSGLEVLGVASPAFADDAGRLDRLRDQAERAGVSWMPDDRLRADTLPDETDLIVAAHAHCFIGRPTRLKAKLGAIGYHPSLLPLHRGRDAIAWSIRMRERVTGGSVYWMTDGVDAGDIAAQEHVFIRPDDTPAELWRRELFDLGLRLLQRVLVDLSNGVLIRIPQDEALATWEPSIDRVPIFRPELLQLGEVPGFRTVRA